MFTSYVMNGQGVGAEAQALQAVRFEPGLMRPFLDRFNRPCVTINAGKIYNNSTGLYEDKQVTYTVDQAQKMGLQSPVFNATSMRKEQWIELDKVVIKAYRERLKAWADLVSRNSYGGFDAMSKLTLEYEAVADYGEAVVDMDAVTEGRNDSPLYKLRSLPLPITHADFSFTSRQLAVAGNNGNRLDTQSVEQGARRIAEMVERTLLGTVIGPTYGTQTGGVTAHDGTSTVYGYTNFPNRITKTNLTVPLGTNPEATVADILAMRQTMYTNKFYGPFMIYHSSDWDTFLDNDYARLGGNNANMTLRDRIRKIDDVMDIKRLDYLNAATNPFTLIMVQMTPDVARAINAMEPTTLQWDTKGGLMKNFKIMAIQVPQLRSDFVGVAGIMHATTA